MTLAQALVAELAADPGALAELRALIGAPTQLPAREREAHTVATLAAELAVSEKTIRGAIRRGELAAEIRGSRYIIAPEAVADWARPDPVRVRTATRTTSSRQRQSIGVMKTALESRHDAR